MADTQASRCGSKFRHRFRRQVGRCGSQLAVKLAAATGAQRRSGRRAGSSGDIETRRSDGDAANFLVLGRALRDISMMLAEAACSADQAAAEAVSAKAKHTEAEKTILKLETQIVELEARLAKPVPTSDVAEGVARPETEASDGKIDRLNEELAKKQRYIQLQRDLVEKLERRLQDHHARLSAVASKVKKRGDQDKKKIEFLANDGSIAPLLRSSTDKKKIELLSHDTSGAASKKADVSAATASSSKKRKSDEEPVRDAMKTPSSPRPNSQLQPAPEAAPTDGKQPACPNPPPSPGSPSLFSKAVVRAMEGPSSPVGCPPDVAERSAAGVADEAPTSGAAMSRDAPQQPVAFIAPVQATTGVPPDASKAPRVVAATVVRSTSRVFDGVAKSSHTEGAAMISVEAQPPEQAAIAVAANTSWTTGPRPREIRAEGRVAAVAAAPTGLPCYNVVRKRGERLALGAFDCDQCRAFYNATGVVPNHCADGAGDVSGVGQSDGGGWRRGPKASRHRFEFAPAATPPGFWDLSFPRSQPNKDHNPADRPDAPPHP